MFEKAFDFSNIGNFYLKNHFGEIQLWTVIGDKNVLLLKANKISEFNTGAIFLFGKEKWKNIVNSKIKYFPDKYMYKFIMADLFYRDLNFISGEQEDI